MGTSLTFSSQPILTPIVEKDIPKVVQAVRQTQSRKVLFKLLTRIKVRTAMQVSRSMLISSARLRKIIRLFVN
jgi:hypothetical protein